MTTCGGHRNCGSRGKGMQMNVAQLEMRTIEQHASTKRNIYSNWLTALEVFSRTSFQAATPRIPVLILRTHYMWFSTPSIPHCTVLAIWACHYMVFWQFTWTLFWILLWRRDSSDLELCYWPTMVFLGSIVGACQICGLFFARQGIWPG